MTPEEIRAAVVQVLVDARLASETFIANDGNMSTTFRSNEDAAQAAVGAMAAAGMLPTAVERGYHCGDPDPDCCQEPGPCSYSSDELVAQKLRGDGPMWQRYVTDWQEVAE